MHPGSRARRILAVSVIACSLHSVPAAAQHTNVRVVDVGIVTTEIRRSVGHPTVVLLYGSECSLSKAMFPGFVQLARDFEPRGVRFLVYNTDGAEYGAYAADFLRRHQASFPPAVVRNWVPGTLSSAMGRLGVRVGSTWTRPLVAVFDRSGRVTYQSQGTTNLGPLQKAVSAAVN